MEDTISPEMLREVKDAVQYLPKTVVQSCVDDDWKFVLLSSFENDERYEHISSSTAIVGLINFPEKTITIRGFIDYETMARDIAIHELCHYTDRFLGNESRSDKLTSLFNKYKDGQYITFSYAGIPYVEDYEADMLYATSNQYEFFAETMKDYLLHPKYLKETYSDIYDYYVSLFREINK